MLDDFLFYLNVLGKEICLGIGVGNVCYVQNNGSLSHQFIILDIMCHVGASTREFYFRNQLEEKLDPSINQRVNLQLLIT